MGTAGQEWVLQVKSGYCRSRVGTVGQDLRTFFIIFRSFLLTMRHGSIKRRGENQNTHFVSNQFFPKSPAVYETWKNTVQP